MDEKLARGRARELFRHLGKRTKQETDPATRINVKILETYMLRGGVEESRLKSFAQELEDDFKGVDQITVVSRAVRHPVKSKIIMEVTRPGCVEGREQSQMIARVNTYVFQRNVLKLIETVHHVAVSQHAVFRLFERGNMKSDSIVGLLDSITLWVPTLLFSLFGMNAPLTKPGTQIALPFAGGLLLGDIGINYLEGPKQGPSITDFRRGGSKLRRLRAPFEFDEDSFPTIGINTYVSRDELFENQQEILRTLVAFAERYRIPMANMRSVCALGYPDEEVTKLLGPPPFDQADFAALADLVDLIRRFFDTPEWKTHKEAFRGRLPRTIQ
ncbi:hypothetical protein SAMN05443247_06041 [Bradyrhizobium erythrophlei]|nr:hypothetical protein SAMN05443247_06041 [Bradyrhizobium erythrophlei]